MCLVDIHPYLQVDILHPLVELQWEKVHKWNKTCYPIHSAVLRDKIAILTRKDGFQDKIHVSSLALDSWYSTRLPLQGMSLSTYKSQFVAVGGREPPLGDLSDQVFTSDAGILWQASLPPMRTERNMASSVGTTSPEVLVVAGGLDANDTVLKEVEVLIENFWYYVEPLPAQGYDMNSTIHQDEVVFTSAYGSIYTCDIASLVSSRYTKLSVSHWKSFTTPWRGDTTTTISYSSRLVNIDRYSFMYSYCSMSQSWVEISHRIRTLSACVLSNGDIITSNEDAVYKVKILSKL